jgi:hypothetical protein
MVSIFDIKLTESITFSPYVYDKENNRYDQPGKEADKNCEACEGTGKDDYYDGVDCPYCKGKGTYRGFVSSVPELNVANDNGYTILRMLGLGNDSTGHIYNKDLPNIIRKLITLKNTDKSSQYTRDYSEDKPKTFVDKSQGIPQIRKTAHIHHMELSSDRIQQYIDKLLEICQVAQEHGYDIAWN